MKDSSIHRKIILRVIPEPEPKTRAVLIPKQEVTPVIVGKGNLDLLCGKCEEVLVDGIFEGQIQNIVIRCPKCTSYNEILFTLESWKPEFPKKKTSKRKKR